VGAPVRIGKVSIATSLADQGLISLYGTTLSAESIDMPNPGEIDLFDNSSITRPAFSNTTGTLWVYPGGTLRLADNPVQLQGGNMAGVPSRISSHRQQETPSQYT